MSDTSALITQGYNTLDITLQGLHAKGGTLITKDDLMELVTAVIEGPIQELLGVGFMEDNNKQLEMFSILGEYLGAPALAGAIIYSLQHKEARERRAV